MYVCNCTAITESQVAQAIENGYACLPNISIRTGKSPQCGRCLERMRDMLAETESRLIAAE